MKMGSNRAIGIDLKRRKRLDDLFERRRGGALERPKKESQVSGETIHVFIARHDHDAHRVPAIGGPGGNIKRLRGGRKTSHARGRLVHARARRCGLEQRLEGERR